MMRVILIACLGVFFLLPAMQPGVACDEAADGALSTAGGHVDAAPAKPEKKFDMNALIERIKKSHAIGMFTKLALRSDALDMVDLFKAYRGQANHITLDDLRARFDGLLLKVLALLDNDPVLSGDISMAREGIWNSLLEVKT